MTMPMRALPSAELAMWSAIPTAVVSDERRHQGVLAGIRPLFAGRPFAAQAFTIEVGSSDAVAPRAALAQTWNGACIVIDSKVPIDAYLSAADTQDDSAREPLLKEHARQVRDHIRTLGAKSYWSRFSPTPGYTTRWAFRCRDEGLCSWNARSSRA